MENKICPDCNTENEEKYIYCKNCGTALPVAEEPESAPPTPKHPEYIFEPPKAEPSFNTAPQYTFDHSNNTTPDYSIDGIPAEEIALYVGKKAPQICPKFMKSELLNSKVSWCWPPAVLGLLLGPMGAAIWFFYRKLYKPALILLLIGVILTSITTVLTFDVTNKSVDTVISAFSSGDFMGAAEKISETDSGDTVKTLISNGINNIADLVTSIICGLFGIHIYKKNCIKRIKDFRNSLTDRRYYNLGLSALGGVSGGMLALGIISIALVNSISSVISVLLSTII